MSDSSPAPYRRKFSFPPCSRKTEFNFIKIKMEMWNYPQKILDCCVIYKKAINKKQI